MIRHIALGLLLVVWSLPMYGEIATQTVAYEHGEVRLAGYMAHNPEADRKGAVLIVHEWWGLNDYAKSRADQLAALGYVAFVVDMYGEGKTTAEAQQAGQWAGALYGDRALLRARVIAGVRAFREAAGLDADTPIAAIGYCFGGTTVTELAYSGEPGIAGVVSFHGNPKTPAEDDTISAKILICHGDVDPLVPDDALKAVTDALTAAEADWMLVRYAGAVHSFTNPNAGAAGIPGVAYQEAADKRSWRHMLAFFDELFGV